VGRGRKITRRGCVTRGSIRQRWRIRMKLTSLQDQTRRSRAGHGAAHGVACAHTSHVAGGGEQGPSRACNMQETREGYARFIRVRLPKRLVDARRRERILHILPSRRGNPRLKYNSEMKQWSIVHQQRGLSAMVIVRAYDNDNNRPYCSGGQLKSALQAGVIARSRSVMTISLPRNPRRRPSYVRARAFYPRCVKHRAYSAPR